jgi:glucosylceramidase
MRSWFLAIILISISLVGCGGGASNQAAPVTPTAATPTISPSGGTFTGSQTVTLADTTSGASIYYTTNGTTPTTASSLYSAAITVPASETIEAIAVASGYTNSAVASAAFTISLPAAATPTFSPAAGTFTAAQSVTLADATTGASIYYTIDGSTPTTSSTLYSKAIAVSATTTINAIAVANGYATSAMASGTYTINLPAAAAPAFSPAAGTFTSAQSVTLSDSTTGASIYYTIDGSTPTASSTLYTKAIAVNATTTIKAIAVASGYTQSAVASGAFTINLPAAATPTFSPAAGTFTTAQSVTLSDGTTGASIYYTTDGSTPTASSTLYSTPIALSSTTTINAIAVASGYSTSAVASAVFTFPQAAAPTFTPAPGTYYAAQSVTLADTTSGSTIYYTTDGSTPTTSSTKYSTAISVAATTTIKALATATGNMPSSVTAGTYTISSVSPVSVVLSTADLKNLMTPQPNVNFTSTLPTGANNIITVDEAQQYQTMDGFGAASTDSAAYLLMDVVPAASQASVLSDLFTRTGNGIGLSFIRNPMGATDIARTLYSFDDLSTGQTDYPLSYFTVSHDQSYVIPFLKQAKALNPQLKIMANPWSPPGWMKATTTMLGGSLQMTAQNETSFANYFVQYLKAYQAAGVPIDYISLQNEPLNNTTSYPSMYMVAGDELTVLRDYVLPALTAAKLTTQVLVWDHNWDTAAFPETVLADPTVLASPLVAGTAWHGYSGTPGAQQTVQNMFPTKGTWQTEHSGGTWVTSQYQSDFLEIPQVLRNAAKAYVKWSLALDEKLGPDLTQDAGLGGCNTCTPLVTVNSSTGAVTKDVEYYTMGHFSKYVLPGAKRIYSSNSNGLVSVAFINPDGSKALFAFNNSVNSTTFTVQWGTMAFPYTLQAMGAATFTWTGAQPGTPTIPATSMIQGSSYSTQTGLQTETTSDTTGGYDLGYVSNGATAIYDNIDFGTSVTKVSVQSASSSTASTATFYLDSTSTTPIATVTLPVTGGWQTWQKVTANVTGATGVHNLYVVFTSGSNVSWFQFQ